MARPVPADLEDALAAAPAAREHFWTLPPAQVDEWVRWIEAARLPRARRRRIAEAVRRLSVPPATAAVAETVAEPVAPPRDSPWLWILALLLLIGIGALIYFFAIRGDKSSKPSTVVVSARSTVPQVVGIREQAAKFQIQQAKLAATVTKRNAPKPRGIVIAQNPKSGASVPQGAPVAIVVSNGPARSKLPDLVGLAAADASKSLVDLKLKPVLKQVASKEAPGTVLSQQPAAGSVAKPGSSVVLQVAKSSASVAVPDVSGRSSQDATAALTQAGLKATVVQVPSSQPKGTVVAESPAAGTKVASGSAVRLNVSKGSPQTTTTTTQQQTTTQQTTTSAPSSTLPPAPPQGSGNDYRGMQLDAAVQKIAQGRQQAIVQYVASSKLAGIVVSNGTSGSKMRLSVSGGPKPAAQVDLPDVSTEASSQAQSDLQSAGFTVITVQWPVSDQATNGTVVFQTPGGGGKLPKGLAIVLYVGSSTTP